MNMNMNGVFYFIVYAELLQCDKSLPCVKDCTRRRLIILLVSRRRLFFHVIGNRQLVVWYFPGISLTRAHYEMYTYRLRSLDRA